jgi:ligand-binding sensor domain-containing protein/signal transduction histidine kinase
MRVNRYAALLAFPLAVWFAGDVALGSESASGATPSFQIQGAGTDASAHSPPQPVVAPLVRIPVSAGGRLSVRRVTTADGLSQTRVAQILQDDRGFIWFGTQYGLNRFDGYEFKVFVHKPGVANSLAGAYIFSLFQDRDGILWVGCNLTLDRFDPRTETFTHYSVDPEHSELGGTVFHISQDSSGALWLATGTGLHRLDPRTGAILHYRHSATDLESLSTDDVKWSGEDRQGNFWVGTADGLDKFDRGTGKVRLHIPMPDPFKVSFFEDRQSRFWVIHHSGNGLALYDRQSNTLTPISFYAHDPSPESLSGVRDMEEDAQGRLWVASAGMGLLQYDPEGRRFVQYRNRPEDPNSVAADDINDLFKDREGDLWLGHTLGANVFHPTAPLFTSFRHYGDDPGSLSSESVSAMYDDSHGSLFIGTENGLDQIDRQTGKRVRTITAEGGTKPLVVAVIEDARGVLWIGSFTRGLTSYDVRNHRYAHYRHIAGDPTSLSNDTVHALFIDHAGVLWVGTDDGLNRFDPRSNTFKVFKIEAGSTSSQRYIAIAEDASGFLWLGTHDSGLHRFDPTTGRFEIYKPEPGNPASLRDAMTPSIDVSPQGIVWIATQNGLNRFDPKTGRFSAYDTTSGLPGNLIDCVLEDGRGNLWLSTNKGLSRFDPSRGSFANYTTADGLPGNDMTGWSACAKNRNGELFFGGFSGAVAFSAEKMADSQSVPHLVLTDFQISGTSATVGPHQALTTSIPYTDTVTLTHEQHAFSVAFAGLQYVNPETVRYRYRLEGLDTEWSEADSGSRRATFTTLPAGNYVLHIQARGSRGSWSEPGISLKIVVLPPWWATWWIRIFYALVIVFATWWAYQLRIRHFMRQLQVRMEERINERTRIAHELHDTLLQGLLSASLQLAVADERLDGSSPIKGIVHRVAEMLRVMIGESRNTVQGLRVSRAEDLEHAIATIPRDLGDVGQLTVRVVAEGHQRALRPAVRDEVYWIARESIANALRHSNGSAVHVTLQYSIDGFRLSVRDDGRGIDSQTLQTGRENHFGLVGMSERARNMRGTLNVSSAPGAGTEVVLTLPGTAAFDGK